MKPETTFRTSHVDPFLDSLENCFHESIQQQTIRGTADKICCIHGWLVWAEVKDEHGTPEPLQSYKASKVRSKGKGIAFVWRPQNHDKVKGFLTKLNAGIFEMSLLREINKEEK